MSYTPGKVVWWELVTRTPAEHAAFYTELIGWKSTEMPMPEGTYTMFGVEPETAAVAGMAAMPAAVPAEVPSHWAPYISVDDVDATAEAVKAHGGQVVAGPMDIPGSLRFAACLDARGATVNVMKSVRGDGDDGPTKHGDWHWAEYYSPDVDATLAFYKGVFGYTTETMDMPTGAYHVLKDASGVQRGGVMARPVDHIPPMWLNYLHTDDVDAIHAAALAGGATELMAPMAVPGVGKFSQVVDPNGAAVGFITPD